MIDWTAVFAILRDQFTLDTMIAHKTAGEKTRAYLRQVVVAVSWSSSQSHLPRVGRALFGGCGGGERS